MSKRGYRTAGETLAAGERSIGTTLRVAADEFYAGYDLATAQAIRKADSDTEAAAMITAMRRGRAIDVLLVAGSAVAGVAAGAFSQHTVGNATVGGVPPIAALGLVPAIAGLAAPVGLSGRSILTTGGVSYAAGASLYSLLVPKTGGEAAP